MSNKYNDPRKVPSQPYKFRILTSEPTSSKTHRPMAKMELEIIEAEPVETTDGQEVDLNGRKITHWCLHDKAALEYSSGINPLLRSADEEPLSEENCEEFDVKTLVGLEVFGIASSEEVPKVNEVTGEPMVNPKTGEPITGVRNVINQFLA